MPFHDLNVLYKHDHNDLSNMLSFHHELGYSILALSISVVGKLPPTLPDIAVSDLATRVPANLMLLSRLTLTISDTTQNHRLNALQSSYDILALRPTTEKTLQLCCTSLECDLISLDFSQRLQFVLRFRTVAAALQRGIRFEICYSCGIGGGVDARRNLISGATSLIRATRGRGIIISSEAKGALGVRAPADIINLAQVWGLSQERGKEAVCEEAGRVIKLAGLKRTSYRGVVDIVDGGSADVPQKNKPGENIQQYLPNRGGVASKQDESQPSRDVQQPQGAKRKASKELLGGQQSVDQNSVERLSKRELKRRAKKARTEGKEAKRGTDQDNESSGFTIQHETLHTPSENQAQISRKK